MISRRLLLAGVAALVSTTNSNAAFLFFKDDKQMAEQRAKDLGELKALRKKAKLAAKSKKAKQLSEDDTKRLAILEKSEKKMLADEKAYKSKLKAKEVAELEKKKKIEEAAALKKKAIDKDDAAKKELASAKKDLKKKPIKNAAGDELIEEVDTEFSFFGKRKKNRETELSTEISKSEVAKYDAQAMKKKDIVVEASVRKPQKKTWTIDPKFEPQTVSYSMGYKPGTIVIDPREKFLYYVESSFSARRYGVAVGKDGLDFHGKVKVGRMAEWPRWIPTKEMQERDPEKYGKYADGMDGGPENPLGARAIYLYDGGKDTYLRIHGTTQPWSIGTAASNGCFRMVNEHVMELFSKVTIGTEVVVL
jgi:lipoprotein-anchoring transpeptidase ErfK/SrfK